MSLAEHFRELKRRVLIACLAIALGAVVGWVLYDDVYRLLTQPLTDYIAAHPERAGDIKLTLAGLTTGFSLHLSIGLFVGVIISSPVWLYEIWAFIVPGLTRKERRISLAFIGASVPLFLAGILLAHRSLPLVIGVLLDFTPNGAANFQELSTYFSFVTRFSLGFGFAFLLPIFLVALNMIGILPVRAMIRSWRVATFLIFCFAAMMMPTPDPYSMMLLAVPLVVLFWAAIGVSALIQRRKTRERPAWLDTPDDEATAL
ncbi:Sec-independent protein translocase protein TatC [Nostocoides japonicum T1-X7]|uniref:Sec-independent protein translocase protein TatC n=2 Tax=Nostocoides japonicum TaxID=99481 RepID=A0A077LVK7_9MICO|nr:Sec-independent protein translocase protein TatC [Tetrasphaera japonica T1-X7]